MIKRWVLLMAPLVVIPVAAVARVLSSEDGSQDDDEGSDETAEPGDSDATGTIETDGAAGDDAGDAGNDQD